MQLTEYGFSGMTLMNGEHVECAINLAKPSGRLKSKNAETVVLTDKRVIHLKGVGKGYCMVIAGIHDVDSVEVTAVRHGYSVYAWAALAFCLGMILFVTIDSTSVHKPHPEPVFKALADVGVNANEALFVGDSTHDLHAGKAAGCKTVAVSWTVFNKDELQACEPTLWLDKTSQLAELPTLLSP